MTTQIGGVFRYAVLCEIAFRGAHHHRHRAQTAGKQAGILQRADADHHIQTVGNQVGGWNSGNQIDAQTWVFFQHFCCQPGENILCHS
ncbi:Uncharacterised protein [Shigella sonnei]|nr:Uncharacterised protein [Shigella sonnei]